MKALKVIGVILIILVVLFFIVALFLPSKVHMEESIVIKKPASLVFKQVNNYKKWAAWSPWLASDPAMSMTYEGPELGVGATYSWTSPVHGDGKMKIIESKPYELVKNALYFMGDENPGYSDFIFTETEDGTKVTWTVDVPHLSYPVERYFGLMMPGMMRKYFKEGLSNLKDVCENMADPYVIEQTVIPETKVITVLDSCNWADFEPKMTEMYGALMDFMAKNKQLQMAGAPFTRYSKWDEANQFAVFEAGFPIDQEVKSRGNVIYKVYPETKAIKGTYFGAYEKIGSLYMALDEYLKEFGLTEDCCPMEVYMNDPMNEPDTAKWQTDVYFPIK